ncbi:hypothetical protein TWF569_006334 [Orbilia oligospora]|uniref:VWFA domain-containing protein n=1 Tax=Orbilia oligospora TaxID=2813651 RepID=A0A7C8NY10_ORBOL|nr:hypothetical protein TWF706_004705 [Orbilia oligospora]KAF3110793.1 hypothetical protein TWF103_004123 [Orbilia oligospora]KAF3113409.1 hypothetical protein TWF102_000071 [Orbilia oligospora]KAF3132212.1 hypothetical protein TWF594_009640 [Orbilia oligospora]KAF3134861.1 hypothetical protein TWF703_006191 [Orbilia oligospora]
MASRVHLPFELDFSFKLKRARRRSQEYIPPQYPFGKSPLVETTPLSPHTPIVSPTTATQTTAPFNFSGLGNAQNFVPPIELPDNTANIPRPQYQNGASANGHSGASNLRPSSWSGAHPELPRIITSPPTMLGNLEPGLGPNRYPQSPMSPPVSPIGRNELGLLKLYRTVFIIDDSTSMISSSHLKSAYDLLEALVPLVTGVSERAVEIQFLSDDRQSHSQKIKPGDKLPAGEIFWHGVTARGGAAMSAGLKRIIKPYLSGMRKSKVLEKEGLNIIVITDGKRKDRKDVVKYIVSVARKLTDKGAPQHLLGIQFVQVGDDQGAKLFFKSVDDGLEEQYQIRDIVDTVVHTLPNVSLTRDCIEKILLGGISDDKDKMTMI